MIGQFLAIHRGKGVDEQGVKLLLKRGFDVADVLTTPRPWGIVAVAKLKGYITTVDQIQRPGDKKWYAPGQYGWILDEVIPIELVPCTGQQKLWKLDIDLLRHVHANYVAAKRVA